MGPLPVLLALGPLLALLSAASWHFIEAPIDHFKDRFRYRAGPGHAATR